MPDPRDIQIHIHEHITPLRERVGKIEGQMQVHDRELGLLRQGLDSLRDRIDGVRESVLVALDTHTADEIGRFESLQIGMETNRGKLDALKGWMIGIGVGLGGLFAVFEFLARVGLLRHS